MRALETHGDVARLAFLAQHDQKAFQALMLRLKQAGAKSAELKPLQRAVKDEEGRLSAQDGDDDDGLVSTLADAITERDYFAQDVGRKMYVYAGGMYIADGEERIRYQVRTLLKDWQAVKSWSRYLTKEVIEFIRVGSPELWERPPLDRLNLLNGLLNVETGVLEAHTPAFLSTIQLPVNYDPAATCPAWDRFLSEVLLPDCVSFFWELVGWLMLPDTAIQKAVLMLGSGGNGKSTAMAALQSFLGRKNTSSVPLHKLESDRFAVSGLVGKLANMCADLPTGDLENTSIFKSITGGDPIPAEYKYHDAFKFTPFARLIFAANAVPRSMDLSEALFDRWLVIPFRARFRDTGQETPRTVLDAQLADDRELSGVLNRSLVALRRLRVRGRFETPESMANAAEDMRRESDPLASWLDDYTYEHPEALVHKGTLYEAYSIMAAQDGDFTMTMKAFTTALRRLRPNVQSAQRTVNGTPRSHVWLGIGLRQDASGP